MIRFIHPEAFLLGAIVLLVLRRRILVRNRAATTARVLAATVVLAALAQPYWTSRTEGRDLIFVLDRSRSMPAGWSARMAELAAQATRAQERGDRIGLVIFGREAVVEQAPHPDYRYTAPEKRVEVEGTSLAHAIETALALVPPGRPASIVLVSDGENTGRDPAPAARDALRRGVRIDAVPVRRSGEADLAVDELALPDQVRIGEPFRFSAWVRCEQPVEAPVKLLRDGEVIARGQRSLRRGLNRIVFHDVLHRPGVHRYQVQVATAGDRIIENNRAQSVVRATGPFRVLCVTPGGRADRLTRSLRGAGLDLVVTAPKRAPLSLNELDGFRAVVLENVPAQDLPPGSLAALAVYVRDLGGGLLMTGGKASFGAGGYHRTEVEAVLPVSMEIREEQRKFSLAMAIALDRSGSMAAPVAGGRQKMDLANLGACAAVELLGPRDSVTVLAVDSQAHVVVPLIDVTNRSAITTRIRRIESMGGGIFTDTALRAAAGELSRSRQTNRHIVLFADAADAEEPGDYKRRVPKLVKAGVTLSVIGLGSERDSDAAFLKDLAKLGKGRIFFVNNPADLPRVFAQETIQVARSSLVDEPTALAIRPDILAVGELADSAMPNAGGYSIAYRKPDGQVGVVTRDDQAAPFFAFWQHGLGRSASFLGEVDGALSGEFARWSGYADFFATIVRWIAGTEASHEVFAELRREGHEAVLTVEVERGKEHLLGSLRALVTDPDGAPAPALLRRVGEQRLEARIALSGDGTYRAAVQVGPDRFLRVPPVTLPYSPEFEPRRDPREGEKTLTRLVRIAEGRLDPTASDLFAGARRGRGVTSLAAPLAWLALLLLLIEIAVRRLDLTLPRVRVRVPKLASIPRRRRGHPAPTAEEEPPTEEPPAEEPQGLDSILARAKSKARRGRRS